MRGPLRGPNAVTNMAIVTVGNHQVVNAAVVTVKKLVGAPTQITLRTPSSEFYDIIEVKDALGDAGTNNITVVPDGTVATTIDGAASFVINSNYGACKLQWNGVEWNVASYTSNNAGAASFASVAATGNVGGATLSSAGAITQSGPAGAAGSNVTLTKNLSGMTDATDTALFTITVPNVIAGATVAVTIHGTLGDGDSTDSAIYTIGVSRVAGAVAKAVAATKGNVGATAGAAGNAVVIITVPAVTGGATATNTFVVTARITRSAGTATNHFATAEVALLNGKAGGVTIS